MAKVSEVLKSKKEVVKEVEKEVVSRKLTPHAAKKMLAEIQGQLDKMVQGIRFAADALGQDADELLEKKGYIPNDPSTHVSALLPDRMQDWLDATERLAESSKPSSKSALFESAVNLPEQSAELTDMALAYVKEVLDAIAAAPKDLTQGMSTTWTFDYETGKIGIVAKAKRGAGTSANRSKGGSHLRPGAVYVADGVLRKAVEGLTVTVSDDGATVTAAGENDGTAFEYTYPNEGISLSMIANDLLDKLGYGGAITAAKVWPSAFADGSADTLSTQEYNQLLGIGPNSDDDEGDADE